jgi:hypothetical protein
MDNKLDIIIGKLDILDTRISKIESILNNINTSTENMDDHINFVENVYTVVKNPISSLLKLYYKNPTQDILLLPDVSDTSVRQQIEGVKNN